MTSLNRIKNGHSFRGWEGIKVFPTQQTLYHVTKQRVDLFRILT